MGYIESGLYYNVHHRIDDPSKILDYLYEQQRIIQLSCISHTYSVSNKSDITGAELSAFLLGATIVWNAFMTEPTHFAVAARFRLERDKRLGEVAGSYDPNDDLLSVASLSVHKFDPILNLPNMLFIGAHEATHKVQRIRGDRFSSHGSEDEYHQLETEIEANINGLACIRSVFPRLPGRLAIKDIDPTKIPQKVYAAHEKDKFSSILVDISREQVKRGLKSVAIAQEV